MTLRRLILLAALVIVVAVPSAHRIFGGGPAVSQDCAAAWRPVVDKMLAWHERGGDDTSEPDAQAHYALAYLEMYRTTGEDRHLREARSLLAALESSAYRRDGYIGWGLAFAWDAFTDGTENPRDTMYTYTTTVVADAFIRAYLLLGDEHYLSVAKDAARTIVEHIGYLSGRGDGIVFRYSDSAYDAEFRVVDDSAMTGKLLSQLYAITGQAAYKELADRTFRHVIVAQKANGNWQYWEESPPERTVDIDLLNWGLTANAVYVGFQSLGDPQLLETATRAKDGMKREYIKDDGSLAAFNLYVPWDLAEPMISFAWAKKLEGDTTADRVFAYFRDHYVGADGGFLPLREDRPATSPPIAPTVRGRVQGWYALAAATWLGGGCAGPGSWTQDRPN